MDSTTFGLSPKKLIRLLRIGSDGKADADASHVDNRASLLTQWLENPLPSTALSTLAAMSDGIDKTSVLGLLKGKTDLTTIMSLKDYTKAQVVKAKHKSEGDVATAIYYGCIASALVYHGQQISSLSYQDLAPALLALQNKGWLPAQLGGLLQEAQVICEQRMDSQ